MERYKSNIVGIDLGTTNTLIGCYDEIGRRGECLVSQDGTDLTPSAVYFDSPEVYTVGAVAREGALLHPDRTAMYFKRQMGKVKVTLTVDGKSFSPQQISALVLKEVKESGENELEKKITDAVITVPAYFNSDARKATIEAGTMSGLNVRALLDEPVAALYHCDATNDLKGKTVLVFDLGGGTTDVLVASVTDKEVNEIAIDGDLDLGGSDWDQELIRYIKAKYLTGRTLEADDEQNLLMGVERAKISLSKKENTMLTVSTAQGRVQVKLTRKEFEKCTEHLLKRAEDILKNILKDSARQGVKKIDKVLLVGGASKMPQITDMITALIPHVDVISKDPDEAVARGAAVYAKLVFENNEDKKGWLIKKSFESQAKKLNRISTRSYGTDFRSSDGKIKIWNMIYKGESLPASKTETFYTESYNQKTVSLEVYESTSVDRIMDKTNGHLLGKSSLLLPPGTPKGAKIEVLMTLDENGVLSISGIDLKSGKGVKAVMESHALLGDKVEELREEINIMTSK